ncbi:Phosphatidylcholine translocator ABCB4, partial [Trichoplax sp. H2]
LMFLVLGSVSGISVFLQTLMYGISGEYMTKRLRSQTFRAILKQEIGWFDEQSHTTGALCNRLATDASEVKGATGTRLGAVIQSIVSMVAALVIAFVYGWKLALVILGCIPFMAVSGAVQTQIFSGGAKKNKDAADKAAEVSTEALENIRTVESLNLENKIISQYSNELKVMLRKSLIQAHIYGLAYGFSQAIIFFTYAGAFRFGAYLVANNEMTFVDMFKVFSAIVFGAFTLGETSTFVPNYAKAKQSAARLFAILERESKINVENEGGERTNENDTTIKFENVNFNYPTRPTIPVLDGITFKVKPGQTIALVGTSGCGKSTSVSLLERFYDTASGSVTVGGKEIRNINIKWLRSLMGIVQQEPILFNTTIAENISYGDNSRTLTRDDIIAAAKSANIHDFIQGLPERYETLVGEKGTQMSGGQKQRIAIARALVRKPRILLLDEATSALDTESEKIVQAALDKAREGRTCIVIAHRLSTIRNADGIAVFQKGKIIEFGTHDELIAKEGVYFKLQNTQV